MSSLKIMKVIIIITEWKTIPAVHPWAGHFGGVEGRVWGQGWDGPFLSQAPVLFSFNAVMYTFDSTA